jgi:hypothetical protein
MSLLAFGMANGSYSDLESAGTLTSEKNGSTVTLVMLK